jgi:hypothetical protein
MAKCITRWINEDSPKLKDPCANVVAQYASAGETDGMPTLIFGPNTLYNIPLGQFECHRTWNTVAAAQNWLDIIDSIAIPVGANCLEKRLES